LSKKGIAGSATISKPGKSCDFIDENRLSV
jgi:hypothetical protein